MKLIGYIGNSTIGRQDQEEYVRSFCIQHHHDLLDITEDFNTALKSSAEGIIVLQAEVLKQYKILELSESTKSNNKFLVSARANKIYEPGAHIFE